MNRRRYLWGLVLLGLAAGAPAATLVGTTVTYNYDETALGLFGTPVVVGDTLIFTPGEPTKFIAAAYNQDGMAITSATVNIDVTANAGSGTIQSLSLVEQGDYFRFGGGTMAGVSGQLRATNLASNTAPLADSINSPTNFVETGFPNTAPWDASADLNTGAWNSGSMRVTVENVLGAISTQLGEGSLRRERSMRP